MKHTFVGKLIQSLVDLFKSNFPSFLAKLVKKIPDDLYNQITLGILVAEKVKLWLDSDQAKEVTDFIPGDWDEEFRKVASNILGKLLEVSNNLFNGDKHRIASEFNALATNMEISQSLITTEVVFKDMQKRDLI